MTYPSLYGPLYSLGGDVPIPYGYITVPPATTWTGDNGATVTTLGNWAPSRLGPPNATPWYISYNGIFERLPQQWDENLRGKVEATITDAWFGCNFVPNPILFDEILNDFPYAYWACVDAAGAASASNYALGNINALNVVESKYGAGAATETFGENSDALLGAETTTIVSTDLRVSTGGGMWEQTGCSNNEFDGFRLHCTDANFPALADGVTIEIWFQITSLAYTIGSNLYYGNIWTISLSNTGFLNFEVVSDGAGGVIGLQLQLNYVSVSGSTPLGLDDIQVGVIYQLVFSFNQTDWNYYLNGGASFTDGTFADGGLKAGSFTTIDASGAATVNFSNPGGTTFDVPPPSGSWNGFTGHIAIFPYLLDPIRVLTHYQAGINAMQQESASWRFERLLQIGNATGRRVIMQEPFPDFNAAVSCQDVPGQPMSGAINNLAGDLLPGMFFIAPTGDIFYLSKLYSWNQPIKWVLGEDAWNNEQPYANDVTFDYDPSRVLNEIQLTQLDNQDVVVPSVSAIETASQTQYGTLSDLATGYLYGDNTVAYTYGPGLNDTANWLANVYANPALRLTTIKIDAISNPLLWPFILGASVGDTVTVNRRSLGQSSLVIQVTGRITQTSRNFEFGIKGAAASIDCIIDPMPEEYALTCDDPVRGVLNGTTNIFGW
jgi:hypothetical protein